MASEKKEQSIGQAQEQALLHGGLRGRMAGAFCTLQSSVDALQRYLLTSTTPEVYETARTMLEEMDRRLAMLQRISGNAADLACGVLTRGAEELAPLELTDYLSEIAACVNELLNAQDEGEIQAGFVFIWDSIGSISCYRSYKSATNNPMWDAAALSTSFNLIVNDRIPRSRKVSSPNNNTFIAVNKVWLDSMSNPMPGAPPSLSLKGGNSMFYSARLIILCGGQLKASAKKLTAKAKGLTYNYAIQTKLKVLKNQLPNPFTVTYEGEVICSPHGMIGIDTNSLEAYKKEYVSDILKHLNELNTNSSEEIGEDAEITYDVEEMDEVV